MLNHKHPSCRSALAALGFMIVSLAGCGGGGSAGGEAAVGSVSAAIAGSAAPAAPAVAGASPDAAPAPAGDASASENPPATPPLTITAGSSAPMETERALGVSSSMSLAGVPESPPAAPSLGPTVRGQTFDLNSAIGNDGNDGLAASAGGASGPWRTLARLSAHPIAHARGNAIVAFHTKRHSAPWNRCSVGSMLCCPSRAVWPTATSCAATSACSCKARATSTPSRTFGATRSTSKRCALACCRRARRCANALTHARARCSTLPCR